MPRAKKTGETEIRAVSAAKAQQGGNENSDAKAVPADLGTSYVPVARKPRIQEYPDGTRAIHW